MGSHEQRIADLESTTRRMVSLVDHIGQNVEHRLQALETTTAMPRYPQAVTERLTALEEALAHHGVMIADLEGEIEGTDAWRSSLDNTVGSMLRVASTGSDPVTQDDQTAQEMGCPLDCEEDCENVRERLAHIEDFLEAFSKHLVIATAALSEEADDLDDRIALLEKASRRAHSRTTLAAAGQPHGDPRQAA